VRIAGGTQFNWDDASVGHVALHRITPEEVEQVFANAPVDLASEEVNGEERYTVIGHTNRDQAGHRVGSEPKFEEAILCDERRIMKKLVVPQFSNEAEEAKWWFANRKTVEANLLEAMKGGTIGRRFQEPEKSAAKNVNIRLPVRDIERARKLSAKKGIGYQTYMKMLLHEALDKEEAKAS